MAHIDPVLHVWGWEVPVYLFLGGLVAGVLFFSALFYLRGKADEMKTSTSFLPLFAPVLLGLGLFALFLDLEYKTHVLRFYTAFKIESPMSWGSWTLAAVFPLSSVWAVIQADRLYPQHIDKVKILRKFTEIAKKFARPTAYLVIIFSVLLGMYTGILLSAFNARPLWNTAILGPLFLVSGLSTGVALSLSISKSDREKKVLSRIDLSAIGIEVFLIIHLFMGLLASTQVHIDAAQLFLGGEFTAIFWILVFGIGLLLPGALEFLEIRGKRIPAKIPAFMVIFGGLMLRIVFVEAGQVSTWIPY